MTGTWIYRAGAAAFLGAALYHLAAVLIPPFGHAAYPSAYPLWRHAVFITINSLLAWLLFTQTRWTVWLVALLTIQIYNGHGRYAWIAWTRESRVAWIDVGTVVGATALLALLIAAKRSSSAPSQHA